MINNIKTVAVALTSTMLLGGNVFAEDTLTNAQVIEKIKTLPVVKQHRFTPTEIIDGGSMIYAKGHFTMNRGTRSAGMFVSPDYETIVYGRGFSADGTEEYRPFSVDEIKENAAFTFGSGKHEYFLVVDPLCSACKSFDKTLHKYEKTAKFHVIFKELRQFHPKGPKALAYVLSGKTDKEKYERLMSISNGDTAFMKHEITDENRKTLAIHERFTSELGTKHTPSLYSDSGRYLDRGVLDYRLNTVKKYTQK